ncbi:hypothetical protein EIK77_004584 [Talaromyces pinophilus]|nr:hypothetical protein EIK77_004584 [Talaromyces pinophilus]
MAVDTAKMGDLEETNHASDDKEIMTDTRVEAYGTLKNQFLAAALDGKMEVVHDLLKKDGITINATNRDRKMALHLASQRGNKDVVQELLKTSKETGNIKALLECNRSYGQKGASLGLITGP